MEHALNHFIKFLIENYFPYPIQQGLYTNDEYKAYSRLARRVRPYFWIMSFVLLFVLFFALYMGFHLLVIELWTAIQKDAICYRPYTGYDAIGVALVDIGMCFPMASVVGVKLLYPYRYKGILDFMNLTDKIDTVKLGKWMLKWFGITGIALLSYDFFSCTLISQDNVSIKTFNSITQTIYYKDIAQITFRKFQYTANNNPTVLWDLKYYIRTKTGNSILLPSVADYDTCAALIATYTGVAIDTLK